METDSSAVRSTRDGSASQTKREIAELTESLTTRLHERVVCLSHSWGGLEQVAANDAIDRGLLGLDVGVICLEGSPIHENLKNRSEVKVQPINFRPRDVLDFKLKKVLEDHFNSGVNLLHVHQTTLLGSIVPWLWNEPQVALFVSRHIMNTHSKRDFYHRALYSRVDSLVVMSQTLRENVLSTHAIRDKQVKVVNLGLDFSIFDPVRVDAKKQRAVWGGDDDTLVIGLVGRIDPAKGQATFVRAAAGLLSYYGREHSKGKIKLKFVIVGEETLGRSSNYIEELKEIVAQFRIEEHVLFAGYQENIAEIMNAFDILVMPSRQEAFGLVAIEAMAMETPIVISKGGSAAEIVGDEEYGLLMRAEDAFDLQRQLRALIEDPERRKVMGKKAREHVIRNYDRQERILRTLELYERILRRRRIAEEMADESTKEKSD